MRKNKTIRTMVLDFVQANGPQSYSKLHEVVLTVAGQPLSRRDYGSSYLDQVSRGATACIPTSKDPRYLIKESDGLYHLAV